MRVIVHNHLPRRVTDRCTIDWGEGISYRSSAYDLSEAGESAKKAGVSKAKLRDWAINTIGLDKQQLESVMGGFNNADK